LPAIEDQIILDVPEIGPKGDDADHDRQRTGQTGALHTQRVARSPAHDQHGGKNDIYGHRQGLDNHRGLDDADATQRGRHREHRKLQSERRHEPDQVRRPDLDGSGVRRNRVHVRARDGKPRGQSADPAHGRQPKRLIEDEIRVGSIFAANGLCDGRQGADAYNLRQGTNKKPGIASGTYPGDGCLAQACHEVKVDQSAEQHQDKSRENGDGHGQGMAQHRALGEVFHDEEVR